jgi:hypothetical protein
LQVVIPVKGAYYIELVATTNNYGSFDLSLNKNGVGMVGGRLLFASSAKAVTRSRALLAYLVVGDILTVAYSNVGLQDQLQTPTTAPTNFQGFLIYLM